MHETVAVFADSTANIHLTHEQRQELSMEDLKQINRSDVDNSEDINLMTTKHYYYGKVLSSALKVLVARRKATMVDDQNPP